MHAFKEFQYPESTAFLPKFKFKQWWLPRTFNNPNLQSLTVPTTVDQVMQVCRQLKVPRKISVWVNKKYPSIEKVEW